MTEIDAAVVEYDYRCNIRAVTVPLTTSPNNVLVLGSPCRLCGWSLSDVGGSTVGIEASTAVVAAAAGTLTLTGFAGVSSVLVSPAAAWPAGVNQVTVTNLSGGTQVADIPGGTTQSVLMTFNPISGVSGTPVVSVPAIVGGPAYTIAASGESQLAASTGPRSAGTFFDGGQPIGFTAAATGLTDTQWLTDEGVYVGTGISLTVTSGQIQGVVYVADRWQP